MKVLVVTNMYPTRKSPFYGIFVKEQVESLRKEGIFIDVVFINGRENRLNYFYSVITLLKKLRSDKFDIIHAHHTYCIYPIAIAKAITGIKIPLILTFHEGEVHKTNEIGMENIDFIKRLVFSKRIKRLSLSMVDMVITVQKELITELNFNGKYVVLPCGVDLDLFRQMDKEWCRKKLNLPHDKKIVFFPASPGNKQKGFDILKEALLLLGRKDVHLLTGGNILHQDMPYYMSASDVVIQLSLWEASPMVLKENMAVNVPLVFTDTGDVKLTIENTEGCFLCDRNALSVALKLQDAFQCNGNSSGRMRIVEEGLGLSDVAKKIIKIYKNLLGRN